MRRHVILEMPQTEAVDGVRQASRGCGGSQDLSRGVVSVDIDAKWPLILWAQARTIRRRLVQSEARVGELGALHSSDRRARQRHLAAGRA